MTRDLKLAISASISAGNIIMKYYRNDYEIKEKGYATNLTTDYAINWLNKRDKKDPFCLLLQYKAPHRQWQPDSKYEKRFS